MAFSSSAAAARAALVGADRWPRALPGRRRFETLPNARPPRLARLDAQWPLAESDYQLHPFALI